MTSLERKRRPAVGLRESMAPWVWGWERKQDGKELIPLTNRIEPFWMLAARMDCRDFISSPL